MCVYGLEGCRTAAGAAKPWRPVPGSSEKLAGLSTRKLLNELQGRDTGRLVLVDLPPVLLSDDALMVAPLLDGVVLVCPRAPDSSRGTSFRVMELLRQHQDRGYRAQTARHKSKIARVLRKPMYEKFYSLRGEAVRR